MRAVLDTNVLISALLWRGRLARLFVFLNERRFTPCFTRETIEELFRVVEYPHLKKQAEQTGVNLPEVFSKIIEAGLVVEAVFISERIPDDPSDEKFLACAMAAQADFIVSGDKHLLRLGEFNGMPILSPRQFIEMLAKQ